jgi:hypothetical protein
MAVRLEAGTGLTPSSIIPVPFCFLEANQAIDGFLPHREPFCEEGLLDMTKL